MAVTSIWGYLCLPFYSEPIFNKERLQLHAKQNYGLPGTTWIKNEFQQVAI
jgi:hypothetical protein